MEIYHAKKQVAAIEQHIHLTGSEELSEGLRAFFGLSPSEGIEERIEVQERTNLFINSAKEFLKQHTDIARYVFPSIEKRLTYWKHIAKYNEDYSNQKEIYCKNTTKYECHQLSLAASSIELMLFNVYNVSFPLFGVYNVSFPFIENSIVDLTKADGKTLFNLGEGNDIAIGVPAASNIFIVNNGHKSYTGGNKDDMFLLQGSNITGVINGNEGIDSLDLSDFDSKNNSYALIDRAGFFCSTNDKDGLLYGYACRDGIDIENIEQVYGRRNKKDRIYITKNLNYIDGLRGEGSDQEDYIHVAAQSNKHPKIVLRGNTRVLCYVSNRTVDSIHFIIPRGEYGAAFVHLRFKASIQYIFHFAYALSNIRGIHTKKDTIIYTLFDQEYEFNVTILDSYLSLKKKGYPDFPTSARYIFQDGAEIKILNKNNFYAEQSTNQTVEEIISAYSGVSNRLNMSMLFELSNNETVLVGHGAHEVMHNNPLHKSHLLGNGGENVYVITSANSTEKFPIPEVTLYNLNMGNFTDTLDLRKVIQQSKIECPDSQVLPKVNKANNDLIIKLYSNHYFLPSGCIKLSSEFFISSVRLQGALVGNWYENLDVALNSAPMKIKYKGHLWSLEPLPLIFDQEIMVITADDVEKETELVTPREAGNYIFARSINDLLVTNSFDQNLEQSERCTISLKDFYQNAKMQTISIKFADKAIILQDHQAQISSARAIDDLNREHKDQVYNDVFNHTKSETIGSEVDETTPHVIIHKHRHEQSRHNHKHTTAHQRSRRTIHTKELSITNSRSIREAMHIAEINGYSNSVGRLSSPINRACNWVKRSIVDPVVDVFISSTQHKETQACAGIMEKQAAFATPQLAGYMHGGKPHKPTMYFPEINNRVVDNGLTLAAYVAALWFKDKKGIKTRTLIQQNGSNRRL